MKNEIQTITEQVNPVILEVSQLNITSAEHMVRASTLRAQLKNTIKIVETVKESQFRPLKDQLDFVTSKFKPLEKTLKEASDKLSLAMGAFQTKLIADAAVEADKIASRIKPGSGNLSLEKGLEKIADIATPEILSETGFVNKPNLVIIDESLIPREFMVPNLPVIEVAIKEGKVVPGCEMVANYIPRTR